MIGSSNEGKDEAGRGRKRGRKGRRKKGWERRKERRKEKKRERRGKGINWKQLSVKIQ